VGVCELGFIQEDERFTGNARPDGSNVVHGRYSNDLKSRIILLLRLHYCSVVLVPHRPKLLRMNSYCYLIIVPIACITA